MIKALLVSWLLQRTSFLTNPTVSQWELSNWRYWCNPKGFLRIGYRTTKRQYCIRTQKGILRRFFPIRKRPPIHTLQCLFSQQCSGWWWKCFWCWVFCSGFRSATRWRRGTGGAGNETGIHVGGTSCQNTRRLVGHVGSLGLCAQSGGCLRRFGKFYSTPIGKVDLHRSLFGHWDGNGTSNVLEKVLWDQTVSINDSKFKPKLQHLLFHNNAMRIFI